LAQYYTGRALRRDERASRALAMFLELLPKQPAQYRAHAAWLDFVSRGGAAAMLAIRRWREGTLKSTILWCADAQLDPISDEVSFQPIES
jgi:hypothetical protein